MNQDQIKELRKLAEAASPGPWRGDRYDGTVKYCVMSSNGKPVIAGDNGNSESGPFGVVTDEDEKYLLVAHPANIIALLDHIATLEQERNQYRMAAEEEAKFANEYKAESAANLQRALVAEKDAERYRFLREPRKNDSGNPWICFGTLGYGISRWDSEPADALIDSRIEKAKDWPMEQQPDGTVTPVDPADMGLKL